MEREPSGHLRVTFETSAFFQLRRDLLRWEACVEVLEPRELRDDLKESAKAMLALYR